MFSSSSIAVSVAIVALLVAAHRIDATPVPSGCSCTAGGTATYTMTFTSTWSDPTPPTSFPHWSSPIGTSHSPCYTMWKSGIVSTTGMKNMAEFGSTGTLKSEFTAAGAETLTTFSSGYIGSATGSSSTTLTVDRYHPLVSVATMIAPSPDWFVGASSENLCSGGSWRQSATVDAYPWDAGTDSGLAWTSLNSVSNPVQLIARITASSTRTSVFRKASGTTASMGTVRFTLTSTDSSSNGVNPQCSLCASPTTAPQPTTTPAPPPVTTTSAVTTPPVIGGCGGTRWGCCPDGETTAAGSNYLGCPGVATSAPAPTQTPATTPVVIGGCAGTRYGCCPDGKTAAGGLNNLSCPGVGASTSSPATTPVVIGGCAGTRYGCCPDGKTAAGGLNNLGCPGVGSGGTQATGTVGGQGGSSTVALSTGAAAAVGVSCALAVCAASFAALFVYRQRRRAIVDAKMTFSKLDNDVA